MSEEIVAVFGKVAQVRDYPSMGITRVIVEIPCEAHVAATSLLYGKNVLVTLAPESMAKSPYGLRRSVQEAVSVVPEDVKGGPLSELAGQWCREPRFQAWLRTQFPHTTKDLRGTDPTITGEKYAREVVLGVCEIKSRKELDHKDNAKERFDMFIRIPYAKVAIEAAGG